MSLFKRQPQTVDSAAVDGDNLVCVSTEALIALRAAGEGLPLKASRIAARQSGAYLSRFQTYDLIPCRLQTVGQVLRECSGLKPH